MAAPFSLVIGMTCTVLAIEYKIKEAIVMIDLIQNLHQMRDSSLSDLLAEMKGFNTEWEKVEILCHLRLYHLLTDRPTGPVSENVDKLVHFLRLSWGIRTGIAYQRLKRICCLGGDLVRPIKYALVLRSEGNKTRYFRDLDLQFSAKNSEALATVLKTQNIIPGDLEPEDWNRYHATETPLITAEMLKIPEFHSFSVDRVHAPLLESSLAAVNDSWTRLSEFQFYTYLGGSFCVRTFFDFTVMENTLYRQLGLDSELQYLDDLLVDMEGDLKKGKICPLQAFEVLERLNDTPKLPRITEELARSLGFLSVRQNQLPELIQSAVLRFIQDRLRRIQHPSRR